MRIEEIVLEAPVGMLKRIGNRFASMVPGSTSVKAFGRRRTSNIANEVKKKLQYWMASTGQNKLTSTNFKIFMSDLGLEIPENYKYQENDYLSRKVVDQTILQSVQQALIKKQSKISDNTYPNYNKEKTPKKPIGPIDLSQVDISDLIDELTKRGQISTPERL